MKFIPDVDKWIVLPSDLESTIHSYTRFDSLFDALELIKRHREASLKSEDFHKLPDIKTALYKALTTLENETDIQFHQ